RPGMPASQPYMQGKNAPAASVGSRFGIIGRPLPYNGRHRRVEPMTIEAVGRLTVVMADQLVDGSNMHCSVGLAILAKVAPIWDCFAGGTQSVSIVGTPVSLMPRSKASRRSLSSTVAAAWSWRQLQTVSGCAQRPTIWGAHSRTNSPRGSGSLNRERKGLCCNCSWACIWVWAWAEPPSRKVVKSAAQQIRTNIRGLYRKAAWELCA